MIRLSLTLFVIVSLLSASPYCLAADSMKKRGGRAGKAKEKKPRAETSRSATPKEIAPEVFYSPTGKSYHCSEKCRWLARSKKIEKGSRTEADKKGLKPCGTCCDEKTGSAREKPAAVSDSDDVFITPAGKAYHTEKCAFLARSKKVETITRAEAEKKGLRACSTCIEPAPDRKSDRSEKSDDMKSEKKK